MATERVLSFFCIACEKWADHAVRAVDLSDYFAPIDIRCESCGWTRTADAMKRSAIMARLAVS